MVPSDLDLGLWSEYIENGADSAVELLKSMFYIIFIENFPEITCREVSYKILDHQDLFSQ